MIGQPTYFGPTYFGPTYFGAPQQLGATGQVAAVFYALNQWTTHDLHGSGQQVLQQATTHDLHGDQQIPLAMTGPRILED